MKFVVGAMLTTFGIFWGSEGLLVEWPLGAATLPIILFGVCATSFVAVRLVESQFRKVQEDVKEAWEQVYGLLVEDGQIAIGTLIAFVATAMYSVVVGEGPARDAAGCRLFVLLMGLLLVNVYSAGRQAR